MMYISVNHFIVLFVFFKLQNTLNDSFILHFFFLIQNTCLIKEIFEEKNA
jgi:hypothetical protein